VSRPPVRVRPAGPADRDQVWPLARALATSYVVERPAFNSSFASLLADPTALLLIAHHPATPSTPSDPSGEGSGGAGAEGGGEVVGYLLATSHPAFHANGLVAWVEEVMVAEPARGAGVGRQLMAAAEAWACRRGARYVALATRRAAPFYRALGYQDSAVYFKKPLT
jgi:GNAT superfamily N-acetyltransferase